MGSQNGEHVDPEIVGERPATAAQALSDQAVAAQALATQAQALATQAQALSDQAVAAQALATQAQALATQSQALATQAQAPTAQALAKPNNDVDQAVKNLPAYKRIANLHDINQHYPIYKLALEEWQRTEEYLSNSVSRREGQSIELTNQIYSIFGIFAVFQGVVLTAVSQLTQTANPEGVPLCGKIWSPIVLSVFVTVVTIAGILHEYTSLQSLESTIHKDKQAIIEVQHYSNRLRRDGPQKFKFPITDNPNLATEPKFVKNRVLVILSVLIFTCICILSYFVILCDTGVVRKWDKGLHR